MKENNFHTGFTNVCHSSFHLDKCDFTLADVTVDIFDNHLSVVFDPALATQDVVNAGCYFVPFVMVTKTGGTTYIYKYLYINHNVLDHKKEPKKSTRGHGFL